MKAIEHFLETLMFASRWLLAPFYLGLVGAIIVLLWYFGIEFLHLVSMLRQGEGSVVVGVLSLVDLVLVANLLIIIIFAGYENFVSKIDTGDHEDRPDWMGHVDFADLKMKLINRLATSTRSTSDNTPTTTLPSPLLTIETRWTNSSPK